MIDAMSVTKTGQVQDGQAAPASSTADDNSLIASASDAGFVATCQSVNLDSADSGGGTLLGTFNAAEVDSAPLPARQTGRRY